MSDNNKVKLVHAKAALEEAQKALELALRDEPGDDSITFRALREKAERAELLCEHDGTLKRKLCVTREVRGAVISRWATSLSAKAMHIELQASR